ncbi:MAG: glycosyltransferase [Lachnospiraceae bacterium]|nr:glycosyltransferase [Lachnospiraceae bacterium]
MKILIFRGKLKNNGISTALVNLLDSIDFSKHSVTLIMVYDKKFRNSGVAEKINSNVRVICKRTTFMGMMYEQLVRKTDLINSKTKGYQRFIDRDRKSLLGSEDFDCVIDFDGYNLYYNHFLTGMKGKKCIWLHNDMMSEYETRSPWLKRNFKEYGSFDAIVSCGAGVNEVNKHNLCEKYGIPEDKFVFVPNLATTDRVYKMAEEAGAFEPEKNCISFISVGRCSVEKNHSALIKAFKRVYDENKSVRLIILGEGPLLDEERALSDTLGIKNVVYQPGLVMNPYAIMKKCDCFILPSLHEGQPMVVAEARALKMPIILGDFSTVEGCCTEDGQLVCKNDEEGLYKAMKSFINGEVPSDYEFNEEKYNQDAMEKFYEVIQG